MMNTVVIFEFNASTMLAMFNCELRRMGTREITNYLYYPATGHLAYY